MRRENFLRFTTLFMVALLLVILSFPVTTFATNYGKCTVSGDNVNKVDLAFTKMEKKYTDDNKLVTVSGGSISIMGENGSSSSKIEIINWNDGTVTFNGDNFETGDKNAKKEAMKAFSRELEEADVSSECRQNIANAMVGVTPEVNTYLIGMVMDSTSADVFTAMKWLGPILNFLRIIIGVGVIIVILLLVASTVMDCLYIGLPVWRENQDSKASAGNKNPFGVSTEAISTVKEVESNTNGGTYKNAYLIYFRRRALTYIILSICILYLILGELGGLIQGLLDMAVGFTG